MLRNIICTKIVIFELVGPKVVIAFVNEPSSFMKKSMLNLPLINFQSFFLHWTRAGRKKSRIVSTCLRTFLICMFKVSRSKIDF